jgi:hypothetical protein
MRLFLITTLFSLLVAGVSTVAAQDVRVTTPDGQSAMVDVPSIHVASGLDFYTPPFAAPVKYDILAPHPCGASRVVKSASPLVFDGTLWVHYLCTNHGTVEHAGGQTEHWIRYLRPQATPPPVPVYLVPSAVAPNPTRSSTRQPVLYVACTPPFTATPKGCVQQ